MRCALLLVAVLSAPAAADGIAPHASWAQLPWSNGHGAGAYDTTRARMTSLREHLFDHTAAAHTRELLYDAYPGLRVAGQDLWLTSRPVESAGYDEQRGIARVVQSWQGVTVTAYYYAPFDADAAATVVVFEVQNTGASPLADSSLFALDNAHVGGGDGTLAERIQWTGGAYEERGALGLVLHRPSPAPRAHGASPQNPYAAVAGGGHLTTVDDSGTLDDAACGFEWDLTGLAPGATARFQLVIAYEADGSRAALDAHLAAVPADPAAALAAARADWDAFFARAAFPPMSEDEKAVYRQSLAVLRMGQVRADGPGSGQLVASLPTGIWNIAWVRDQAYAVEALANAALIPEAKAAVDFWWSDSHAGTYVCCDNAGGPYVGAPYALSVVRYTGDGQEESDADANGPNIEFDGFGLALAATNAYVQVAHDATYLDAHADALLAKTGDVLLGLVETSGENAGLLRADSSIWETHWENGGRKHFAFTNIAAIRGLEAAAAMVGQAGSGHDNAVGRYTDAAAMLRAAVAARFPYAGHLLRGNLEEDPTHALDAAAVEALDASIVAPTSSLAAGTLDAWKAGLWNSAVGHGYHRNDDGGEYDTREWVMIDLRIAVALGRAGRAAESEALFDWVTQQARQNFDLVPENYDRITGDYLGAIPMVGFGAGAYVSAMWQRGTPVDPGYDGNVGGDGIFPKDGHPSGCCDAGGGGAAGSALLATATLFAARRRRAR